MNHNRLKEILLAVLLVALFMGAKTWDRRDLGRAPVVKYQAVDVNDAVFNWETGEGHAAQTDVVPVNFTCDRVDVILSSVTANPTVTVTLTADTGATLATFATLADGTNHFKTALSDSTDFNAFSHAGNITVSVDPSADAGGAAQTLTAEVYLFGR